MSLKDENFIKVPLWENMEIDHEGNIFVLNGPNAFILLL
jgi:hypothetical protein